MKTEWTLPELQALFPAMPKTPPSVFRCVASASGHGRYLKESGGRRYFADVRVKADPAKEFLVRLLHEWPPSLSPFALAALNDALLRGMVEGSFNAFPEPIWECSVACTVVTHVSGETTPLGISIAGLLT